VQKRKDQKVMPIWLAILIILIMTSIGLFLIALSGGGPTAILFQERPGVGVPILFMPDYSDILPVFIHDHLNISIFKYVGRFILLITIVFVWIKLVVLSVYRFGSLKFTTEFWMKHERKFNNWAWNDVMKLHAYRKEHPYRTKENDENRL